jgi:multiple sugar transport system substrate-binding protein
VGLGAGTSPNQQAIQRNVVSKFNETHPNIKLTLQIVDFNQAPDTLAEQFDSGDGPDIIGPMGIGGSNRFHDEWFDLTPLIVDTNFDLTQFNPELVNIYKTDEGQVGLPFAVFPAAVFYNKKIFDRAGLAYPPASYGEMYTMPDGTKVEWNWDTLTQIARLLTLDQSGRNATEEDFDADNVVQYGYVPQWQSVNSIGTFWGAGTLRSTGNNAVIPPQWESAWKWYYEGMWGDQPFIPNQNDINTQHFGSSNPFSSASIAMAITQSWYIGAFGPNIAGGNQWDLAALPTYEGKVHGSVDADTFRIWKGTEHPREAFEVLTYFIGPASEDLLRAYGAVPARTADQDAFFAARKQQFSWVKNWDVLRDGLNYPDIPSAEAYMPNFGDATNRLTAFGDLLRSTDSLNIDAEIATLRRDLEDIFKR